MTRRINTAGLSLIKNSEGLRLKAYRDAVGVLTIGYGSTGAHVTTGMVITEQAAEALLKDDLDRFERGVEAAVKVPLNDNQFAALVSFAFNLGVGALQGSTLLKKLNAGDYASVPAELSKWNKAGGTVMKGLVVRREAEGKLFTSNSPTVTVPTPIAPQPTPEQPAKPQSLVAILAGLLGFKKG